MRCFKILILTVMLALLNNIVQAQGIFHVLGGLRGLGGDRSLEQIEPKVYDLEITDVNSLKDLPKIKPEKYIWYTGITAYNPIDNSNKKVNIPKGLYTWSGTKWIKTYSATPKGSYKGDLQALRALQQHPDNWTKSTEGYHSWSIDLENIDNPKNLNLSGVFFREINGEQRIVELQLNYFHFKDITITEGLEALAHCTLDENPNLTKVHLKLPSLIHFVNKENESLLEVNLNCPMLGSTEFQKNKKLTVLDISNCLRLSSLLIRKSPLITTLDVSKNTELSYLICNETKLSTLDVSKNTKLSYLQCNNNALTTLDVSRNKTLMELHCSENEIDTLDVSKNITLQKLGCSYNNLKDLDVTNNLDLIELWCNQNRLTALDFSKNINLTNLECSLNFRLTSLDVSNCVELKTLKCSENELTALDLSNLTKLEALDFYLSALITTNNSIKICNSVLEKADNYKFRPKIGDTSSFQVVNCK